MAAKPWVVSDELWGRIEPLLPKVERRFRYPGRKRRPEMRPMATTTETRTGTCSTHGTVETERPLPKLTFPFGSVNTDARPAP